MSVNYKRNIAPAKKSSLKKSFTDLTVILLCAGKSLAMQSYGTRSLLEVDENTGKKLIDHQLDIIAETYPGCEIVVVVGYKSPRLISHLKGKCRIVLNPNYETTNITYSIYMGLLSVLNQRVLLIPGDLIFNKQFISGLGNEFSAVHIDSSGSIDKKDVGVILGELNRVNGLVVTNFAYGLPTKWAQTIFLAEEELKVFKNMVGDVDKQMLYPFELLNQMINKGMPIKGIENKGALVREIDILKNLIAYQKDEQEQTEGKKNVNGS